MTALARIAHKIFGSNAPLNEIGQFGSAVATTKLNTKDVATIQNLPAYEAGWGSAVVSNNNYPALEEMTGAMNVMSYQTGYLFERGIPEWINTATYYTNCFCSLNGKIYISQTDNNINHDPSSDTTNWSEFKAGGGYHPTIFSHQWCDHIKDDIQWLRADTFSWQSGSVYVTAYNELVSEYNNASSTTETEGSVTFKRTPKGYKIALATQETAILNKYNTNGIAWYYILDTANTRFKLPRTKFGFKGLRDTVGNDVAQTVLLPNITGIVSEREQVANENSGAFYTSGSKSGRNRLEDGTGYYTRMDASRSSSVYSGDGTNTLIDERATQMYLYFYVGEYAQSAIEQTAGLNSELFNGKADINLNNCVSSVRKIDGQWVMQNQTLSTTAITGTYTLDLSSYLPNDGADYEVMVHYKFYVNGNYPHQYIYSDLLTVPFDAANVTSSAQNNECDAGTFILPVRRYIYYKCGGGLYDCAIIAWGYRRIGTNT